MAEFEPLARRLDPPGMRRGQVNWLFDRPCSLGTKQLWGNRNRWGFTMVFRRLVVGAPVGIGVSRSPDRLWGQEAGPGIRYPDAPRSETVEDYHGTKVADPYRPLEDPDSPATRRLGRGREQDHVRLPRSDSRSATRSASG